MSSKLKEIRIKIDKIDTEILTLLEKRFKLAMATKKLKKQITDKNREKEVIESVLKRSEELRSLEPKFIQKIFKSIISESKRIQHL